MDHKDNNPPAFDLTKLNFNFGGPTPSAASAVGGFNFGSPSATTGTGFTFDLSSVSSKFSELLGQSSGYREALPLAVQNRIKTLELYHDELMKVESEFEEEVRKLEIKYYSRYKPIWEKRAAIVTGKVEPTTEELAEADAREKAALEEDEEDKEPKIVEIKEDKKDDKKEDKKRGKSRNKCKRNTRILVFSIK